MSRAFALSAAAAIALAGCDNSGADTSDDTAESGASFGSYYTSDEEAAADEDVAEFDEDAARADAEQEVAGEVYSGSCTIDCSGHDAGFAWAADGHEDGGVSSSPSFDEGQEAYEQAVEERLEEKREEFEDEGAESDYAI